MASTMIAGYLIIPRGFFFQILNMNRNQLLRHYLPDYGMHNFIRKRKVAGLIIKIYNELFFCLI
ncbi:hypothetical protein DHD80_12995 [Gramella sp. AN32]|nr:hypothetical protein [Gramella sp. AN32]